MESFKPEAIPRLLPKDTLSKFNFTQSNDSQKNGCHTMQSLHRKKESNFLLKEVFYFLLAMLVCSILYSLPTLKGELMKKGDNFTSNYLIGRAAPVNAEFLIPPVEKQEKVAIKKSTVKKTVMDFVKIPEEIISNSKKVGLGNGDTFENLPKDELSQIQEYLNKT